MEILWGLSDYPPENARSFIASPQPRKLRSLVPRCATKLTMGATWSKGFKTHRGFLMADFGISPGGPWTNRVTWFPETLHRICLVKCRIGLDTPNAGRNSIDRGTSSKKRRGESLCRNRTFDHPRLRYSIG